MPRTHQLIAKPRTRQLKTTSFLDEKYSNNNGSKELAGLGLNFDYPKPTQLIMDLIKLVPNWETATVMDFFAGSGTTGEAVMKLNAELGSSVRFILCTKTDVDAKKQPTAIFDDFMLPRLQLAKNNLQDTSDILAFEMQAFAPEFTLNSAQTPNEHIGQVTINAFEANKPYLDEAFNIDASLAMLESERKRSDYGK